MSVGGWGRMPWGSRMAARLAVPSVLVVEVEQVVRPGLDPEARHRVELGVVEAVGIVEQVEVIGAAEAVDDPGAVQVVGARVEIIEPGVEMIALVHAGVRELAPVVALVGKLVDPGGELLGLTAVVVPGQEVADDQTIDEGIVLATSLVLAGERWLWRARCCADRPRWRSVAVRVARSGAGTPAQEQRDEGPPQQYTE